MISNERSEIEKLNIVDLTLLKFTSVKLWSVNFTYGKKQYFLHDDSDEDSCLGLYHRKTNRNNRINGKITLLTPTDFIKTKFGIKYKWNNEKCNIVYSQIDKEYFVKKLTYEGLIDSCYQNECERIKMLVDMNSRKIKEYEQMIWELREQNKKIATCIDCWNDWLQKEV